MLRNIQALTFKKAYFSSTNIALRAFAGPNKFQEGQGKTLYEQTRDKANEAWDKVKDKAEDLTQDAQR